ncbi:MAG: PP2C family protein-serine/threonine phosphatase, partial [Actinomycetota bacterium]
ARSYPARLASGDYYTYAATTNGLMFAVGDVSGKGLSAALVMTMVSSATTAATNRDVTGDPARILADVSADVYDYLSDSGVFVTTAIGVWDAHESTLKVANAGHSPVLHCHGDRTTSIPPAVPPLGVLPDVAHEPIELVFEPGDALLFGSDGLAEQEDAHGRQLGYDALDALLISHRPDGASALVDRLFDAVERHGAGQPQDDDRTALVVARREGVT